MNPTWNMAMSPYWQNSPAFGMPMASFALPSSVRQAAVKPIPVSPSYITRPAVSAVDKPVETPESLSSKLAHTFSKARKNELVSAGVLFTLGMMSHQLPVRARPGKSLVPTDWKAWGRIGLGIATVNKINKAFGWDLPPWLGAIEAVTVINFLALKPSIKSLAQWAVMAPLVAGVVQGASMLHDKIAKPLEEKYKIPPLISRLGISVGLGAMGIVFYPRIFKSIIKTGVFGNTLKAQLAQSNGALAGSALVTCARGCSPGSIICLSETAEIMGGFANWLKDHTGLNLRTPEPKMKMEH